MCAFKTRDSRTCLHDNVDWTTGKCRDCGFNMQPGEGTSYDSMAEHDMGPLEEVPGEGVLGRLGESLRAGSGGQACSRCGAALPGGARFCSKCGNPMPVSAQRPLGGAQIPSGQGPSGSGGTAQGQGTVDEAAQRRAKMMEFSRQILAERKAHMKGFYLKRIWLWPAMAVLVYFACTAGFSLALMPGAGLVCLSQGASIGILVEGRAECPADDSTCVQAGVYCLRNGSSCPTLLSEDDRILAVLAASAAGGLGLWYVLMVILVAREHIIFGKKAQAKFTEMMKK